MKAAKITLIAIIVITALLLTGCQEEQLAQCQLENEELQKTVKELQLKLSKIGDAMMNSSQMVSVFAIENEKLMNEIKALKKAAEEAAEEKQTQKNAPEKTPEQTENIRKGLEQLRKLQQESAERMRKEAAEKPAQ